MTKETIWLIIAGAAALVSVPLLYSGLQNGSEGLAQAGLALFTASMLVTPIMKVLRRGD